MADRADPRRTLGEYGERLAERYLTERGMAVIDRNWRCARGELDLVAWDGDCLVFCEVKTRRTTAFGAPVEAITRAKQMRIRRLAARWLEDGAPGPAKEIRFDVASVLGPRDVEIIEGAF